MVRPKVSAASPLPPLPRQTLRRQLRTFLDEDRADRDITSEAVIPPRTRVQGVLEAQGSGVVSGLEAAEVLAEEVGLESERRVADGATVRPGTALMVFHGDARRLLAVERTLVNLVMHLSGVATETAQMVEAAADVSPTFRVAATRKTLPGLRDLQKRAVIHGGGDPHRRDLASAILIKGNHLALVPLAAAVRRARAKVGARREVMVEVRSWEEAREAVVAGADRLILDNFSPAGARRLIRSLEREGLRSRVVLEVSGGVSLKNIQAWARTGADLASSGALTHSVVALPVHLVVTPWPPPPSRGRRPSKARGRPHR